MPDGRARHPRWLCGRRYGRDGTVVASLGKGGVGGQPDATASLCRDPEVDESVDDETTKTEREITSVSLVA